MNKTSSVQVINQFNVHLFISSDFKQKVCDVLVGRKDESGEGVAAYAVD